jgi:hypothetical protein
MLGRLRAITLFAGSPAMTGRIALLGALNGSQPRNPRMRLTRVPPIESWDAEFARLARMIETFRILAPLTARQCGLAATERHGIAPKTEPGVRAGRLGNVAAFGSSGTVSDPTADRAIALASAPPEPEVLERQFLALMFATFRALEGIAREFRALVAEPEPDRD